MNGLFSNFVGSQFASITVPEANPAPVAIARPQNLAVISGALVQLYGEDSTDDNSVSAYLWEQITGDAVQLSDNEEINPEFLAPSPQLLRFSLKVADNLGKVSNTAISEILVATSSLIANAGPDQSVFVGSQVQLSAALSSDENNPNPDLQFTWELTKPVGSQSVLSNVNSETPTFTPDVAGVYIAEVAVNNGTFTDLDDTEISASVAEIVSTLRIDIEGITDGDWNYALRVDGEGTIISYGVTTIVDGIFEEEIGVEAGTKLKGDIDDGIDDINNGTRLIGITN